MDNLNSQVKDKCFTPSKEKIKIDFETSGVKGKTSKLTLEVYDFGDTLIAQFDYDCSSSLPTVEWDGTLNKVSEVQKEPFATPLRYPYTIKIVAEYLQQVAINPDSVKITSLTMAKETDKGWFVSCKYTAKNKRGVATEGSNGFYISNNKVILREK